MRTIDCFFIGHNEIDMMRQRQLLRLSYGENSHLYNETNMSKLGYIKYKGNLYSSSQIFNKINQEENIVNKSFSDVGISETFSLSIAYLGTFLHKNGFSIDFINSFNKEKDYLASVLSNNKVLSVVIPTTYYVFASPILDIISFIRKYNTRTKIIVGGPYVANRVRSLDEEALQRVFKAMDADIFIYNTEGEKALGKVMHAIKNNLPLNNIKNIFYKNKDKYWYTGHVHESNELDENIVQWELFADRVGNFVNVRTSISCPFTCQFCNYPIYAGKYRQASIDTIEEEMNRLNNISGITGMWIIDDTFNFPPSRFKEILKMMIRNRYKFRWHSFLRCQYLDEETVRLMKESGCDHVLLGIESGSQKILNNMSKNTTVHKYYDGISLLNKYEIASTASMIVGFPGETLETYTDTVKLIEEAQPTFFRSHMWYYDSNAPISKQKDKYSLGGEGLEWKHDTMDSQMACTLNEGLFKSIKNSIYETECPIPFHLLNRGISISKIQRFLSSFNDCIKEKIKKPVEEETSFEMYKKLRDSLISE
ncbi:radical SAM protein [Pelosinus fermentans]|uniref:Radical SAM domain protein n=1 Tax=Pelosinus fermentans JBW45 TaxID=1192197 RepID=I9NRD6_9FIRM|nr:radical SAM protein [Pelosinus fermentans]AJQ26600.1 Radical SAM domain protein [Pelosinus fermentans JBW45]